jgi:hypothetical protein
MAKRTTPSQPWTPYELERQRWVEALGYPTLLNVRQGHDLQLRRWAEETQASCIWAVRCGAAIRLRSGIIRIRCIRKATGRRSCPIIVSTSSRNRRCSPGCLN